MEAGEASIMGDSAGMSKGEHSNANCNAISEGVDEELVEEKYCSGGSWRSDEYPPLNINYEALKQVATQCLSDQHGKCTDIKTISRGSYHEIRVLIFEDRWSCIGRFTRNRDEHPGVMESETATIKYVRHHTSIPVPETYFETFDPTNTVGAAFVLTERIPGTYLYTFWYELTIDQKVDVMGQIADVLAQLSTLKFDKIGSLNMSGTVGPLQNLSIPNHEIRGPFNNMEEFMFSFIPEDGIFTPEVEPLYSGIRKTFHKELEDQNDDSLYIPPFRLIHGDFDGQNMLFTWPDSSQPPKLSGIIDWDYSYIGPLYYLYEYPIFIRDVDTRPSLYDSNKVIRKQFVRTLVDKFPKGSIDRQDVREAFRQKNYGYNWFRNIWMPTGKQMLTDAEQEKLWAKHYTDGLRGRDEYAFPYGGRLDYEPDSELESEEEQAEAGAARSEVSHSGPV